MKSVCLALFLICPVLLFSQSRVGINTDTAEFTLDVRSIDPDMPGLQVATQSENHFIRLFGGHLSNASPFLGFSHTDTFRLISSAPDYSEYRAHMAILPGGNTGFSPETLDAIDHPFMVFADETDYIPQADQSNPAGADVYDLNPSNSAGQSFTVGADGLLSAVAVVVRTLGPGQAKFNYAIKQSDPSGPVLDMGTLIVLNTSFESVSVPINPIPVMTGDELFFELTYDSDAFGEWSGDMAGTYASGEAWLVTDDFPGWVATGVEDLGFSTTVDVAVPNYLPAITVLEETALVKLRDLTFPAHLGTPGQVLTPDYLGKLSWTNQTGVFENIGGVVQNTGDHSTEDFVFGAADLTATSTNYFFFDKSLAAFRAGRNNTSDWQPANLGQFSFSSGWNTKASGYASQAFGQQTAALADYSTAFGLLSAALGLHAFTAGEGNSAAGEASVALGRMTTASGLGAFTAGDNNLASGYASMATGTGTVASGVISSALGSWTIARGFGSTVVGVYNDPVLAAPDQFLTASTPLFIIGNGDSNEDRSNALVVRKNGHVGVGTNIPDVLIHAYADFSSTIKAESAFADAVFSLETPGAEWQMLMDQSESDEIDWRFNTSSKMVLTTDGRLAVGGEQMATGYALSVHGKMIAEEVRCQVQAAWPDYVFEEDYPLMSLGEIELSIRENGHLPGIPSADQIDGQGVDLGDMQVRMMEKIEEMTLHMIQLNKRIETLERENARLRSQ